MASSSSKSKAQELAEINISISKVLKQLNNQRASAKKLENKETVDKVKLEEALDKIYKLELEQKRLEEDAFVYNWLQQQLKLSPAYNKMLEIGVSMEKEKSCKMGEIRDDELCDISFEELLHKKRIHFADCGITKVEKNLSLQRGTSNKLKGKKRVEDVEKLEKLKNEESKIENELKKLKEKKKKFLDGGS
ncbi:hypothetical protein P8452_73772 [Trifolium repens]|nr:hypothetical protein P8452_73772 [Trifolium repens]